MAVALDTSVLLSLYLEQDDDHARVAAWYDAGDEDLVTTPLLVNEMDHLLRQRGGVELQQAFWRDLEDGAMTVRWWSSAMSEILAIVADRPALGLADASLLALARLLRTDRIATLDHKHFRPARTVDGAPFQLLP